MLKRNRFGTQSFEFIEFVTDRPEVLSEVFLKMGFSEIAHHNKYNISQFKQGNALMIVSDHDAYPFAHKFFEQHGPSACSFGINVADPKNTVEKLNFEGLESFNLSPVPNVFGVGGSILYFVNNWTYPAFRMLPTNTRNNLNITHIDHITHNVYKGEMDEWANWYKRYLDFYEIRKFSITGEFKTGLLSRALADASGNIRIPINEPTDPKSQIQEYLDQYNGPGIQHIAIHTDDIYETVSSMKNNGIKFLSVPDSYYDKIEDRIPEHGEDINKLRELGILLDGDRRTETTEPNFLLQIFTEPLCGPIFFEIIQRKGNEGFGHGNFQALFDSMEYEQKLRGVFD